MSYDSLETSGYAGRPYELYQFSTADAIWYLTSADQTISYLGQQYTPLAIKRTNTNQTAEAKGGTVRVTLPKEHAVAQQFVAFSPDSPMFLVIFRGHLGDPDVVVNFTGKVTMSSFGDFAELNCIPESDVLKNSVPAMAFQAPCNHFLYDSGCTIDKTLFATPGVISVMDPTATIVTITAAGAKTSGWFTAGYIEIGQQRRMIMLHAGDVITLMSPLTGIAVGAEVTLYAGCMRDFNTCKKKFNNSQNYIGFQWVPTKNPFKDPFY
jgi:uncharacterized phage protein (TIGR02218 family)